MSYLERKKWPKKWLDGVYESILSMLTIVSDFLRMKGFEITKWDFFLWFSNSVVLSTSVMSRLQLLEVIISFAPQNLETFTWFMSLDGAQSQNHIWNIFERRKNVPNYIQLDSYFIKIFFWKFLLCGLEGLFCL